MYLTHLIKLANSFYQLGKDDDVALIHYFIHKHVNIALPFNYKKAEKSKPTIYLVRHGNTLYNGNDGKSCERLRGWLDLNLSDRGYEDAEKIAQFLYHFPISRIISSDLNRARDTAKAIQRYTDVDLSLSGSLRPWNMGHCVGQETKIYVPIMIDYIKNKPDEKMPGSTESFNFFKIRVLSKIKELQEEAINDSKHIVMVAHSRNCRLLESWILAGCKNVEIIDNEPLLRSEDNVKPGHIMTIEHDGNKWNIIKLPNQDVLDK